MHIYQHSFISIHRYFPVYTHMHTHKDTGHKKTLWNPNEILHYEAGTTAVSKQPAQKGDSEIKPPQLEQLTLNGEWQQQACCWEECLKTEMDYVRENVGYDCNGKPAGFKERNPWWISHLY